MDLGDMGLEDTRRGPRGRWSGRSAAGFIALLALAVAAGAQESPGASATDAGSDFWLLTEFDWGDDPETVRDSLDVSPGFTCGTPDCGLVRVSVDGEHVLARFDYEKKVGKKSLWRIAFVTPRLDRKQADDHLARVWRGLIDYVSRFREKPVLATTLPSLDSLVEGEPHYTHFWKSEDMEIRIALGLSYGKYFVGAFFSDPARADQAKGGLAPMAPMDDRLPAVKP